MLFMQLDCLSTESYPVELRTSALGLLSATGRLGSALGQLVFAALIATSPTAVLLVAAGMLLCGALASVGLPADTTNRELQYTVGDDQESDIASSQFEAINSCEDEQSTPKVQPV